MLLSNDKKRRIFVRLDYRVFKTNIIFILDALAFRASSTFTFSDLTL